MQLKKVIYEISISKSFVWDTSQELNCNSDLNYTTFTDTLNKNRLCLQFCTAAKCCLFLCWQNEGTETNVYSGRNLNLKEKSMRKITSYGASFFAFSLLNDNVNKYCKGENRQYAWWHKNWCLILSEKTFILFSYRL